MESTTESKMCLFNTASSNIAGYCKRHHVNMTVKQIKCKNCLDKQCWHLIKNEDHDWWRQREVIKQRRKDRKARYQKGVM